MVLLRFGPLRLRLHGSDRWLDLARQRYGDFVRPHADNEDTPSRADVRVDYEALGNGPSPRLVGQSLLGPMDMERDEARSTWRLLAPGVHGGMDERSIRIRGPLATFPLDSAMIALWSLACGPDAAVVHGALLADCDRGWLCTGPSGVGKSTLAGLLPQRALCDELVGVRVECGEPVAYSLPFWRGRPGRVRLAGVHFLAHGPKHEQQELTNGQAFSRLHSQILWPSWSAGALAGAFRVAAKLAELPAGVLSFRPEASVWHHVAMAAGAPCGTAEARAS